MEMPDFSVSLRIHGCYLGSFRSPVLHPLAINPSLAEIDVQSPWNAKEPDIGVEHSSIRGLVRLTERRHEQGAMTRQYKAGDIGVAQESPFASDRHDNLPLARYLSIR